MVKKRKVMRIAALLVVVLAAGNLLQTLAAKKAAANVAAAEQIAEPKAIVALSAGADDLARSIPAVPAAPLTAMVAVPAVGASVAETTESSATVVPTPAELAATKCLLTFDLMAEPSAMIGLTLIAPCHENERVVVKHAGLVVSARTTASGSLFTSIPAMDAGGAVEVLFSDGETASAAIKMPEIAAMRRFAVQWQADDAFQIHAFENGASYSQPGHVSAADPHRPAAGIPAKGGFLVQLGDPSSTLPLVAEVYSFPVDPSARVDVVVEAEVTAETCGRELLGETLTSIGGKVKVTDLTLAMPDCDGVGDFLVLKNLVPDMKIAAAN